MVVILGLPGEGVERNGKGLAGPDHQVPAPSGGRGALSPHRASSQRTVP